MKSPELLARYTDSLLKRGIETAEWPELEEMLGQVMTVFKYIEDKEMFQRLYSKMFSERLVHVSSVSEKAERSMISKLKEACGLEYANELQRMFLFHGRLCDRCRLDTFGDARWQHLWKRSTQNGGIDSNIRFYY